MSNIEYYLIKISGDDMKRVQNQINRYEKQRLTAQNKLYEKRKKLAEQGIVIKKRQSNLKPIEFHIVAQAIEGQWIYNNPE